MLKVKTFIVGSDEPDINQLDKEINDYIKKEFEEGRAVHKTAEIPFTYSNNSLSYTIAMIMIYTEIFAIKINKTEKWDGFGPTQRTT